MDVCDRIIVFYRGPHRARIPEGKDDITTSNFSPRSEGETAEMLQ